MHTILLTYDNGVSTDCEVFVDAVSVGTDTVSTASVTFTENTYGKNSSVNYIEHVKFDNAALNVTTPDVHYEINDLTTSTSTLLLNRGTAGSARDGIPSFPLWTTGLVGTSTAFLPPTVIGAGADVTQPDFIGALGPIDDFVATPVPITLPFSEAIDDILDYDSTNPGQEIPSIAFWLGFGVIFSLITLVIAFKATGNIIFTVLAVGAIMALFVSLTIFSIWQVFVFAVIATAIALIGRGIVSSV